MAAPSPSPALLHDSYRETPAVNLIVGWKYGKFHRLLHASSESRLYTFSDETKTKLRKFRLGTSRAKDPQAVIYEIDKKTLEIRPVDDDVYSDVQSLADELPDHAPRFVLLSYPLTLDSGRLSVPYVMLYYLPITCNSEVKMLYAGAKELMRNTSEVGRIVEIDSAEDLEDIEEKLKEHS